MSRPTAHAILPVELENRTAQAPGRRRTEGRPDTRYRLRLRIAEPAGKGRHLESRKLLIVSNTETVPGKKIVEFYGVVTGSTVRAKHIGKDILAGLKNIVGGELSGYTELLKEARHEATQRMIAEAQRLGANAVVNVRFSTSSVAQGAAELFAYGTAVRVE